MQLIIRTPTFDLLASISVLTLAIGVIVSLRPAEVLVPLLVSSVMTLFWTGLFWLDIRRAERYFQQALMLREDAS